MTNVQASHSGSSVHRNHLTNLQIDHSGNSLVRRSSGGVWKEGKEKVGMKGERFESYSDGKINSLEIKERKGKNKGYTPVRLPRCAINRQGARAGVGGQ